MLIGLAVSGCALKHEPLPILDFRWAFLNISEAESKLVGVL